MALWGERGPLRIIIIIIIDAAGACMRRLKSRQAWPATQWQNPHTGRADKLYSSPTGNVGEIVTVPEAACSTCAHMQLMCSQILVQKCCC
jgi:hypothetical protein